MKLKSIFFYLLVFFNVIAYSLETEQIEIPLRYNYIPENKYWAKFGTLDSRPLSLWLADNRCTSFGTIQDDDVEYTLVPETISRKYFDRAFFYVLTRYGIQFDQSAGWRLIINDYSIKISKVEGTYDTYACRIVLQIILSNGHEEYVNATVENEGVDEVDFEDDISDCTDLIDETLHGAIVKIWASQVLYTDKILGRGAIRKMFSGTYAFVPDDSIKISEPGRFQPSAFYINQNPVTKVPHGATVLNGEEDSVSVSDMPAIIENKESPLKPSSFRKNAALEEETSGRVDTKVKSGIIYSEDKEQIAQNGKRITLGILPFENATGHEELLPVIKTAQQMFQQVFSDASTVRVIERERLSDILKEQALGLSGIISDSSAVKVGNITGVQVMTSVDVTVSGGYYRINARLINVETSRVVAQASVKIPDITAFEEGASECAAELLYKFTEEKMTVNRSSMPYPSVLPRVISAVTASVEDAWAVAYNPAALMKVQQRDVAFFLTSSEFFSGTINGQKFKTRQPLWSDLGIYASVPLGSWFASGFGIRHYYPYPRVEATVKQGVYNIKEEQTVLTLPFACGISPKFSFGLNMNAHIGEYQIVTPHAAAIDGNPVSLDLLTGVLWKFSPRFKIGLTYSSANVYESNKEKVGEKTDNVDYPKPHTVRFGTAMYPLKWLFLFADLEYEKYPEAQQYQPGFDLGIQFTKFVSHEKVFPKYSMLPLYIGYTHRPYNRLTNTQQQYFSIGAGFYLNNIHVQWAFRRNVGKESDRKFEIGSQSESVQVTEAKLSAPLYFSIGYRF
jgi:hypothetical protein